MVQYRKVEKRVLVCAMCGIDVELATLDSPHPEAPTLFQAAHQDFMAPWFGILEGDERLVVLCSESCAQNLLKEG